MAVSNKIATALSALAGTVAGVLLFSGITASFGTKLIFGLLAFGVVGGMFRKSFRQSRRDEIDEYEANRIKDR